ncbi:MAG: hypothetical protein JO112_11835 [Planctomycetes bacterium]|nr:hypothetical protein [Planctomycetota bacterium]
MVTTQEYEQALEQIKGWPAEVRLHFAQDVLRSLLPVVRQPAGTPDQQAEPVGDDKLLLHMHRMEKLG